jgi:hypothetical protein
MVAGSTVLRAIVVRWMIERTWADVDFVQFTEADPLLHDAIASCHAE